MNFLAHAYLSFDEPSIIAGNMISDFVKGNSRFSFSAPIQKGITLHRAIDEFTDGHPATKNAKQFFRADYRLYSGPIIDILYDHFLANDVSIFTESSLYRFSLDIYQRLEQFGAELPPRFLYAFTYMKNDNWLYNYRFKEGIQKSLKGLARRAVYISESETAYNLFVEHYVELNACYQDFFEDVKQFAKHKLEKLLD